MENNNKVRYCPHCLGVDVVYNKALKPNGNVTHRNYPVIYKGFVADELRPDECLICGEPLTVMTLTISDWAFLTAHSQDIDFLLAMDKLKHDDIVEYNIKVSKLKQSAIEYYKKKEQDYTPKCPVCGSPDVVKISTTRKLLGVSTLGLASNSIGKSMKCKSCGYKF